MCVILQLAIFALLGLLQALGGQISSNWVQITLGSKFFLLTPIFTCLAMNRFIIITVGGRFKLEGASEIPVCISPFVELDVFPGTILVTS